jgi:colanic acid/amylovoran biosynthesis glycosyltransferase
MKPIAEQKHLRKTLGSQNCAYLVNQYPKVSHSFIRREVLALERLGWTVHRLALRGWEAPAVDPSDRLEADKTAYALRAGLLPLVGAALRCLAASPSRFLSALKHAIAMGWRADRPLPYHLVYLLEAAWVAQRCQAEGVRHLHAHFGTNSAEIAVLASVLSGIPCSFTVHGPEEFDKPEFLSLGHKVGLSAFVVAISSYGRSQLYRWVARSHWSRVKVVHCGLDRDFHQGDLTPPPAAPRLVCVGRLCEQKGQLLLVQAAALLRDRGVSFELVLAGDGDMRADIEVELQRLSLVDQVRITGWISGAQVREELLAARAMVLPSFAEGLPVVIMEAMVLQRPVLSTYVAGIPELVVPGQTGWLFPAGDVEAIAQAMAEALGASTSSLQAMGQAARQRVLERHDIDTEAAKLAHWMQTIGGCA